MGDTQGNGTREPPLPRVGLKFLGGIPGSRHKPHPFRNPRPLCCPAPIRREPGYLPIRRCVRRALQFGEPIGRQPERGLPGHVGAAGCLDTTCGQEGKRRASGDLGDPAGVRGLGRARAGWRGVSPAPEAAPGVRLRPAVRDAQDPAKRLSGPAAVQARSRVPPVPRPSPAPGSGACGGGAGSWALGLGLARSAPPLRPASDHRPSPSLAEAGPPPRRPSGNAGCRGRWCGAPGSPCLGTLRSTGGSQRARFSQIRAIIGTTARAWGRALCKIQLLRSRSPKWQLGQRGG